MKRYCLWTASICSQHDNGHSSCWTIGSRLSEWSEGQTECIKTREENNKNSISVDKIFFSPLSFLSLSHKLILLFFFLKKDKILHGWARNSIIHGTSFSRSSRRRHSNPAQISSQGRANLGSDSISQMDRSSSSLHCQFRYPTLSFHFRVDYLTTLLVLMIFFFFCLLWLHLQLAITAARCVPRLRGPEEWSRKRKRKNLLVL